MKIIVSCSMKTSFGDTQPRPPLKTNAKQQGEKD